MAWNIQLCGRQNFKFSPLIFKALVPIEFQDSWRKDNNMPEYSRNDCRNVNNICICNDNLAVVEVVIAYELPERSSNPMQKVVKLPPTQHHFSERFFLWY